MSGQNSDSEIVQRVAAVFSKTFGRKAVFTPELKRTDLALWTSMKHVEFIIGLEQAFGVRFDGADATDMVSIPVVLERVRRRLT